jgi:hypothetical protein
MTFRLSRLLIAAPILASIALLSPASGRAPAATVSPATAPRPSSATAPPRAQTESPSRLDYLLLASLADSSSLMAMAAVRAPGLKDGVASLGCAVPAPPKPGVTFLGHPLGACASPP